MSMIKTVQALSVKGLGDPPPIFIDPQTYRSQMTDLFLTGGQGPIQKFLYTGSNSSLNAYKCPPVAAIINKKAQAYINGKTWVMDKEGKEDLGAFATKVRARFNAPNPLQSWKQFEAQNYIFQQIFGFCIVLSIIPVGWKGNENATSMWNIPGNMLDIKETGKLWYQTDLSGILESVTLSYRNEKTTLPIDALTIFKDFSPSFSTMVFPESRIAALEMPISNIIGALESRGVLINYRGALGILSSDSDKFGYVPIKEPDRNQLQNDFKRYGLKNQQWKFIITSAAVKWQQMGVPTKDLMLFEEIEDDIFRCCDAFGYPDYLMSGGKTGTFANVGEAKKTLYQDTIIPEADSMYDQWNNYFKAAENKVNLQKDFSHIAALQEDKVNAGRARLYDNQSYLIMWLQNLLTANEWRQALGMDTVTDWDVYYTDWIKMGKSFGGSLPVPQPAPDATAA